MIEMPSATAIGLSPEVLVQSSLEQRIGVNQQGPVLRECFIKKSKRLLVWIFLEGGVARREGWFSNSFTNREEGAGGSVVPCTGTWVRAPL